MLEISNTIAYGGDLMIYGTNHDVDYPGQNTWIDTERFGREGAVRNFVEKNVGTVHTVQGQESDVVILVLGSRPGSTRARDWASEKPNLLNVAASRAKRRLYVIGNRDNWKNLRYFNVLATTVPVNRE